MNQEYTEKFVAAKEAVRIGVYDCLLAYLKEEYEDGVLDLVFTQGEESALRGRTIEEQLSLCRFFDGALANPIHLRKFNKRPVECADLRRAFDAGYEVARPNGVRIWRVLMTRDGIFLGFLVDGNDMLYLGETVSVTELDTSGDNNGAGYKGGEDDCYALSLILDPDLRPRNAENCFMPSESERGSTRIVVPDGVTEIAPYAFCGSSAAEIFLPEGVTRIGRHAFEGCEALVSVSLPSTLRTLGVYAFAGCSSLREITLPEGVTQIPEGAFQHCTALEKASLLGVERVGFHGFYGCTSLAFPTFGRLRAIGSFAFADCNAITTLDLPDGLVSLGFCAFQTCAALRTARIPATVREMEEYLFDRCEKLKHITLAEECRELFYETQGEAFSLSHTGIPDSLSIVIE